MKIRKYVLLHKEFDPDEAELTRTRKLRRGFMEERYGHLVDAIYNDETGVDVEAMVKYRDGREAVMKTNIKIWLSREDPS
jgi:long-chain acyl-CoA synthetase